MKLITAAISSDAVFVWVRCFGKTMCVLELAITDVAREALPEMRTQKREAKNSTCCGSHLFFFFFSGGARACAINET